MLTSQTVQVRAPWLRNEESHAATGVQTLLKSSDQRPQALVRSVRVLEESLVGCDGHDCQHRRVFDRLRQ